MSDGFPTRRRERVKSVLKKLNIYFKLFDRDHFLTLNTASGQLALNTSVWNKGDDQTSLCRVGTGKMLFS